MKKVEFCVILFLKLFVIGEILQERWRIRLNVQKSYCCIPEGNFLGRGERDRTGVVGSEGNEYVGGGAKR